MNPMVLNGSIFQRLGTILLPPPVKPLDTTKKTQRKVTKGRVFSTEEMLNKMMVSWLFEWCNDLFLANNTILISAKNS